MVRILCYLYFGDNVYFYCFLCYVCIKIFYALRIFIGNIKSNSFGLFIFLSFYEQYELLNRIYKKYVI